MNHGSMLNSGNELRRPISSGLLQSWNCPQSTRAIPGLRQILGNSRACSALSISLSKQQHFQYDLSLGTYQLVLHRQYYMYRLTMKDHVLMLLGYN